MMNDVNQEDSLDRQLREAAPYIDDEGFTARVLKKLPAQRPRRDSLRAVILLGITLLASALAYTVSDGGRFVSVGVERLAILPMIWIFALAVASGVLMTGLGLAAAISNNRRQQVSSL
jgi:anti-sigma factor RsiW